MMMWFAAYLVGWYVCMVNHYRLLLNKTHLALIKQKTESNIYSSNLLIILYDIARYVIHSITDALIFANQWPRSKTRKLNHSMEMNKFKARDIKRREKKTNTVKPPLNRHWMPRCKQNTEITNQSTWPITADALVFSIYTRFVRYMYFEIDYEINRLFWWINKQMQIIFIDYNF